jgi:hypothetical protein
MAMVVGNAGVSKMRGVVIFGDICLLSGSGPLPNGTIGAALAGRAATNSRYWDASSPLNTEYVNVGTKASPVWAPVNPVSVSLTAAQLVAMEAAPVSVIAAPGAGFAIVIDSVLLEMTTTSTVFTGGGAVSFVYHGTGTAVHAGSIPASVVTAAAGVSYTLLGPAAATTGTTAPANTGVDITNATAPFAAGTGTAKVKLKYRVIAL